MKFIESEVNSVSFPESFSSNFELQTSNFNGMPEIDSSIGAGGGQVLRSSLALSILTGQSFRMQRVRANRKPKPGLQPQHLASVRAAAAISGARISGDSVGSSVLTFDPGPIVPGKYRFAIGTAGSTSLVLHTVYLPLIWRAPGPSEVVLEGGRHVTTSPCFHFLDVTWRAHLRRLGIQIGLQMTRPGFYPRGGGQVVAHLQPCSRVNGLTMTKCPPITKASGLSDGLSISSTPRSLLLASKGTTISEFDAESQAMWPGNS